jgi:hypothetical protein
MARQTGIALRIPIITLVLAAIAIPVELRPLSDATLGFSIEPDDVAENIAGFVAVGIVLGEMGLLRATVAGGLISGLAEASQFFMAHRDPSATDVISNVIGTMLGAIVCRRWRFCSPVVRIRKWNAALAAAMASLLIATVWAYSGDAFNERGAASPGMLEARWKFDEGSGRVAFDSSGHGLDGIFHNEPRRVAGVRGAAAAFDSAKGYAVSGPSQAFRLTGSMTISAWINSTSFPKDDAAIVSQFKRNLGYQLDTTVDKRLRGIGFKLANSCGDLMARYGATPLAVGEWYHIAGVYDAEARTLDVYLNGKLDNGPLVGTVSARQRSSRSAIYIGRRSDMTGFEFAGSIDDVRIYSFALGKEEVDADMRGEVIRRATGVKIDRRPVREVPPCGALSEYEDSKLPVVAATAGALIAIACVGFWGAAPLACLVASFASGLLLLLLTGPSVPLLGRWMIVFVSLAGGASVAVSRRR